MKANNAASFISSDELDTGETAIGRTEHLLPIPPRWYVLKDPQPSADVMLGRLQIKNTSATNREVVIGFHPDVDAVILDYLVKNRYKLRLSIFSSDDTATVSFF